MNTSSLFALSFLASAAVALAESTAPKELPFPPPAAEDKAGETAELAEKNKKAQERQRVIYTQFYALLAPVHDKDSADAAAPRLKAWIETEKPGFGLLMSEPGLEHFFVRDGYGSTAFRELLPLFMQDHETAILQQFRSTCLPLVQQRFERVLALAAEVEAVSDKASAHAATKAIRAFLESAPALDAQIENASEQIQYDGNTDTMFWIRAIGQKEDMSAHLLRAYGHALAGSKGSWPELEQAFRSLLTYTEHPEWVLNSMTPESFAAGEEMCAVLHEWLHIAATVHDTASADAAADWLEAKRRELGSELARAMQPRLSLHVFHTATLGHLRRQAAWMNYYLKQATPPCYGSAKLQRLLQLEPKKD